MIRFQNVYFAYEENSWAVENLSFTLKKGELVALLGSNGSGKSTIARLADGLLLPNKGKVFVDDIDSAKDPNLLKSKVGIVFQNPDDQFVGTTVEEDIAFGLENLNVPRDEARRIILDIVRRLKIEKYLKSSPSMLSGGEKQKVAIAGALAMRPDYLVLDEITALLDPVSRKEIFDLVTSIARDSNIGVLYITHISEEALLLHRIILLSQGKKVKEGTVQEIFSDRELLQSVGVSMPAFFVIANLLSNKTNGLTLSEEKLLSKI
jgi:energy-coupling factor transport system ATP-binding protein